MKNRPARGGFVILRASAQPGFLADGSRTVNPRRRQGSAKNKYFPFAMNKQELYSSVNHS
jgi:hypothetical protein